MKVKKPNIIDEIWVDLTINNDPNYIDIDYIKSIKFKKINRELVSEYINYIWNIKTFYYKILRYSVYFDKFYSISKEINNFEALKYHVHSYLEDLTVLKNKIEVFLGKFKNGIKRKNAQKAKFFEDLIVKTKNFFENISDARDPHHHDGMEYVDEDILKSQNNHQFIMLINQPAFCSFVKSDKKSELQDKKFKESNKFFEIAKNNWINQSIENDKRINKFLNELLSIVQKDLYLFLSITPVVRKILKLQKNGK